MENNLRTININDLVVRLREPNQAGPHPVILLMHGWTGDENAMWVFASRLPKDAMLLAPRGLYETPLGGYGWHPHKGGIWPWVDDFLPAIENLKELLTTDNFPTADFTRLSMVGFSQGAAMSYAFILRYPYLVTSVAGLSGFLPDGSEALARNKPLTDKGVFLAHGTEDELVPVSKARYAVEILNMAGAKVSYCEDNVGHRLSTNCFKGMQAFFSTAWKTAPE